jgi:SAM-dependent methyltransferase
MKPVTAATNDIRAHREKSKSLPRFPRPFGSGSESSREITYDLGLLARSRTRWDSSPGLRAVYRDIFLDMQARAVPGPALELGSGCGALRETLPEVVTSDVAPTAYADLVVSAYAAEDAPGGPWSTIYLFDVLHHLRDPLRFLGSASRALRPGGRLVICDPAATGLGRWFYRFFHAEPVAPERIRPPYVLPPDSPSGEFANMGMAWALFGRDEGTLDATLPTLGLRLREVRYRDVLAYPGSGGFSGPRLIPAAVLRVLLRLERRLPQAWLRWVGLRMLVTLERPAAPAPAA